MEKLDSIEDTKANTGERGTVPQWTIPSLSWLEGSKEQTVFDFRDTLRDKSASDLDFDPADASQYLYVSIMLWLEQPYITRTHEKHWEIALSLCLVRLNTIFFHLAEALGYNCISNVSIRSTTSVSVGSHEQSAQLCDQSIEFCGNTWTKCTIVWSIHWVLRKYLNKVHNCLLENQRNCRIPLHLRQMQHRQIWVHIFLIGKDHFIFSFHPSFFIIFWV